MKAELTRDQLVTFEHIFIRETEKFFVDKCPEASLCRREAASGGDVWHADKGTSNLSLQALPVNQISSNGTTLK